VLRNSSWEGAHAGDGEQTGLNFDELAFGELEGSETINGEAIGIACTRVVEETRKGPEIIDVLTFFVGLHLGSSSDTVTAEGDFNAAVAAAA
jgi:hypothetical protein